MTKRDMRSFAHKFEAEIALQETYTCLGEPYLAAYRLVKNSELHKDRIRKYLKEGKITPTQASRYLRALKKARKECC